MFLLNHQLQQSDKKKSSKVIVFSGLALVLTFAITNSIRQVNAQAEKDNLLLVAHYIAPGKVQDINSDELAAAELKLLQKTYVNDPVAKRLQRLELLAFGTTQYGSNLVRWQNIQGYLRDKKNGKKNNYVAPEAQRSKNISTSLNELEKYVYKKTFPYEASSKRLDKLEAKLFGKPSINMPADQRIARLQRTLGLASTPEQMADMPNGMPPGFKIKPHFYQGQPGMPNTFGFNNDDMADPDLSQFESQMSQIFREMDRQMQDQMREPNNVRPNQKQRPYRGTPQSIPQPNAAPEDKIPPYNDPNFI